jgi:ubiquinone/menaquinone biosynthesis C-methylase UbiE
LTDLSEKPLAVATASIPSPGVVDIFRIGDQFHSSALLHFAVAERIFDALTEPRSCGAIAGTKGWNERKTGIVLNALAAIGLIQKSGELFRNSRAADQVLVTTSAEYIGGVIDHQRLQWALWSRISEIVAEDGPLPFQQEHRLAQDDDANRAFNAAMIRLSRLFSGAIAALPDFRGRKTVLDLAGGHGSYMAAIAAAHPEMTGEIWDLATTEAAARAVIKARGIMDRVVFRVRDISDQRSYAGVSADVVMLNDCLHYFAPATVARIVGWAAGALLPGGALVILSMKLDDDGITPAFASDFSLHMMVNAGNGGLHSTGFLIDAMRAQGLSIETKDLLRYNLLVGRMDRR